MVVITLNNLKGNTMNRKDFMTQADKTAMGAMPRTHQNCFKLTGKNRPGKTACERAKKNKA